MRYLIVLLHRCVVYVVQHQKSERVWDWYGSKFEHAGQTFWDSAYYWASGVDASVYDWFEFNFLAFRSLERLHARWDRHEVKLREECKYCRDCRVHTPQMCTAL